jgi:hypothetical protein
VLELAGGEPGVDRHRDRTEREHGVDRLYELRAVREVDEHPVAGPDTERSQPGGDALDGRGQRGIAKMLRAADDGGVIGAAQRVAGEQRLEAHRGRVYGPPIMRGPRSKPTHGDPSG